MQRPTAQQVMVPLVVLLVLLAGCSGGGGGDGGDGGTTTAAPTATATQTQTQTSGGTTTAGGGGTTTAGGGGGTTTTTSGGMTTTTSGGMTTTTSGGGQGAISPSRHAQALRNAGSYTIEYNITGFGSGGVGSFVGMEKVEIGPDERYATLNSTAQGQSFNLEYYTPPNDNTTYQRISGQVRQVPRNQAFFLDFARPTNGTTGISGQFTGYQKSGTVQTSLGSATKYTLSSVNNLPQRTRNQFDSIQDVEFTVVVDDDTGLFVRYDYYLKATQDGEQQEIRVTIELTDIGSTTVQKPSWAPN